MLFLSLFPQVGYCNPNWKKVDYIIDIFGTRMGVSVTRAMSYPNPSNFSEEDARRLLYKKLYGLVSNSICSRIVLPTLVLAKYGLNLLGTSDCMVSLVSSNLRLFMIAKETVRSILFIRCGQKAYVVLPLPKLRLTIL